MNLSNEAKNKNNTFFTRFYKNVQSGIANVISNFEFI